MKKASHKKPMNKTTKLIIAAVVLLMVIVAAISGGNDKKETQPTTAPIIEATATPEPTASPTPAPTVEPTVAPTEIPTLKQGAKGDDVKAMQERLIELGYLSGAADGDFGGGTLQAVKDFQICNGLKDDGVAGADTLTALYRYNAVRQRTVYVSSSGVYHIKSDCSGMKKSTEMKLSDAIRKGYTGHDCK